jgi:transcriptional regulator with XRE-family HTH domain
MADKKLLEAFGRRIKQLRTERGLSQEELAFGTGFHRTYIGMVERGERNLSLSNVGVFAKTFGLSISQLLGTLSKGATPNK